MINKKISPHSRDNPQEASPTNTINKIKVVNSVMLIPDKINS